MGAKCKVCNHPKVSDINADLLRGDPLTHVAPRYGLSVPGVHRHKKHIARSENDLLKKPAPAPPPTEGLSPKERAKAHCDWLAGKLKWAEEVGAPAKDIAAFSGQYNIALRNHARMSGGLDITVAQIVRHPDFLRIMRAFEEAVGDDKRVWDAFHAKMQILVGDASAKG